MKKYEITSLSSKGQIVIPTQIRKRLALAAGTKMAIMTDGKNVLLQKIESPRISKFNDLIARSQELTKRKKLKKWKRNTISNLKSYSMQLKIF